MVRCYFSAQYRHTGRVEASAVADGQILQGFLNRHQAADNLSGCLGWQPAGFCVLQVRSHVPRCDVRLVSADGERRSTMRMLWDVLARIAAAAEARAGAGAARTQALLRGAREYLEDGHVTYLQNTIQSNRAQVGVHNAASLAVRPAHAAWFTYNIIYISQLLCSTAIGGHYFELEGFLPQASLGGAPTRQSQVQAFLRIREKDAGPLDFDSPGGVDTTWHRIYLCLRSGFHKEAVEVSICRSVPSHLRSLYCSRSIVVVHTAIHPEGI